MNEIEYILRIVLKARDELAGSLKKAREELRLFANAADSNKTKIDALNTSIANLNDNAENVTDKFRQWRAVMQGTAGGNESGKRSFGQLAKEVENTSKSTARGTRTMQSYRDEASRTNREVEKLAASQRKGGADADYAAAHLKKLGNELEALSKKLTTGTQASERAFNWARKAREYAAAITAAEKQITEDAKEESQKRVRQAEEEAAEKEKIRQRALKDFKDWADEEIRTTRDKNRVSSQLAREEERERRQRNASIAAQEADAAQDRVRQAKAEADLIENTARTAEVRRRMGQVGRGQRMDPGLIADARLAASEFKRLSGEFERNSDEASHTRREHESLRSELQQTQREANRTGSVFSRISQYMNSNKESVASLDNTLRGMGWLLAAGFAQQLITILGGLGGAFVAVAASAAQAGAAIGGAFVAGIGQALPAIGLLVGAMARVSSVMDVVKQAQNAQQAAAVQGAGASRRNADATDAVRNAQDGLRSSQESLRDAHESLADAQRRQAESAEGVAKARQEARRDLEDLILAEKRADLAARGAVLSQKEAQEQLRLAMQSGDVEGLARAELAVLESQVDAEEKLTEARRTSAEARGAKRGGVEGMEGVQRAKQQAAEADRSVTEARRGIENAERAVAKAARGIETAKRNASEAAAGTQTAAATLNYLLSQLSPAERRLYTALTNIQEAYKKTYRPISDLIIDSFTRSVKGVQRIMLMPEVIQMARRTAQQIARQLNRVFDAFTSGPMIEQFLRIAEAGRKNLKPVADIAISVGKALANIAETAGPALSRMLRFISGLADQFEKLTGNKEKMEDFFTTGEKHFEAWIRLGLSVIRLFLALAGAGGAQTGVNLVKDATKAIDDLTKKVNNNKGKVAEFFEDARHIVHLVVGVVKELAVELGKSFTPERVEKFTDLLKTVLIPAFGDAIRFMGDFSNAILTIADTPIGKQILTFAAALFIVSKIFLSTLGVIIDFGKGMMFLLKPIGQLLSKIPLVSKLLTDLRALSMLRFAMGGGIGIAIGLFVLLLAKLGLLDEVWDEIQQAFNAFWGQVQPPLERFVKSFEDLWAAISEGKGAFAALEPVLRVLIKIGGFLLEEVFKAIGQVLGGLIDIIGGFVDIITGLLTGDFSKVWEGVKDIIRGAINAIIGLFTLVLFRGLGSVFRLGFRGLASLGKWFIDLLWGNLKRLPGLFSKLFDDGIKLAWGFLRKLPGRMWELAKDVVSAFWRGYRRLGQIMRNAIDDAWQFLKRLPGRFWDLAKDIVGAFWRGYRAIGRRIRSAIEDVWGWLKRLPGRFADLAQDVVRGWGRIFRGLGRAIKSGVETVWDWLKGMPKRMGDIAVDAVKAFGNAFKSLGKTIIDTLKSGVGGAGNLAKSIVNGIFKLINDGWNRLLGGKEFGAGPLKFKIPKLDLKLQKGGPVPGYGSGDTVAALLEPGEHVLTKQEVAALGGHGAVYALRRALGGGGQGRGGRYAEGGEPKKAADAGSLTIEFRGGKLDDFASTWRQFWNVLAIAARRGTNAIEKQFRDMRVETKQSSDRMYRDVRESLEDIQRSFTVRGKRIVNSWAAMWNSLAKVTNAGLQYIGSETNKGLKGLGEKHINFGFTPPKGGDKKATGGFVGGQGQRGRDRYHTVLGAGEAVLNWQHQKYIAPAVEAYYGHSFADTFSRVHGYHGGGAEQPGMARGGIVPIPGMPGESIHSSILAETQRLIRRYKLLITDGYATGGHAPNSDHYKGLALDIVPGPGGSWGLVDQLAHKAEPTQNAPVKPWRWVGYDGDTGHGRGNHLHLSWLPGAHYSGGGEIVDEVKKAVITGPEGAMRSIGQASLDTVRKAANKLLSSKYSDTGEYGTESESKYPKGVMSQGQVESTIRKALKILDITKNVAMWVKTLTRQASRESSFNPNAVNNWDINAQRGDPSKGLIQIIGTNFARYKEPGHNNIFNPLDNILSVIKYTAARYGGGSYDRGVQTLWARGGGAYARGGEIPGGEGMPVPILAHAREWILNPKQQARLTQMLGMPRNLIKNYLGFPARSGQAFQVGGEVEAGAPGEGKLNERYTAEYAKKRLANLRRGLYELPILPLTSWESVVREAKRAFLAISRRGRALSIQVGEINKQIKELEKGDETKEETKKIKALKAERKALIEGGTMVKEIEKVNKEIKELEKGSENAEQLKEIAKLRVERRKLQRRGRRDVAIQARLQTFRALTTEGGIIDQMDAARERFSARLARGLTLATYRFNRATGRVTRRLNDVDIASKEVENSRKELRRIIGEEGVITRSLKKVNSRLKELRRGGITETEAPEVRELVATQTNLRERFATIRESHAQALERVFQAQVEKQQKIVDEISARYESESGGLEIGRRYATALGDEGAIGRINDAQRDMLTRQANELEGRINAAKGAGATDLANQLATQVADLRAQIFESIQQDLRDSMDRINARAQRRLGRADLAGRVLDAVGAVGLTSVAAAAGASRGSLYGERAAAMGQQQQELLGLRGQAEANRNVGLVEELNDQLAELEVAIMENTKAYFDARVEDVNSRASFALNVNDLNKQITELQGTASGQLDQAKIANLLMERDQILRTQGNELQALLLEAQAAGNQQAVNDLTVAMLENQVAILQNTQALDEANGLMKDPQSFTSTAWTWFREAIFSGMGQVLPQYDPSGAMSGVNTGAVLYPSVSSSSSVTGDTNIILNESGRPPDLTEISSVVTFASKTAQ